MALYAAHLTRTLQGRPSIFQVVAQESLGSTVKPALKKLIEFLADVYPNKFGWCLRWFDEVYLVFDCCLQYHYLKHYAASFSESFYGLMRVPISVDTEFNSGNPRLPKALERGSLAMLVLLPYLRDKVERLVDKWREDHEDGRLGKSTKDRIRVACVRVYSVAHVCWYMCRLAVGARYVVGGRSASPALAALRLQLRDAPPTHQPDLPTWGDLARSLLTGNLGGAVVTFPMVGGAVVRGAEYGAYLVHLLRWWERAPTRHAPPTPQAPPQRLEADEKWRNKCPICLKTWKIPTVLPVSGYVFCYVCISRQVRATGRCPATGCPTSEGHLVRLYLD